MKKTLLALLVLFLLKVVLANELSLSFQLPIFGLEVYGVGVEAHKNIVLLDIVKVNVGADSKLMVDHVLPESVVVTMILEYFGYVFESKCLGKELRAPHIGVCRMAFGAPRQPMRPKSVTEVLGLAPHATQSAKDAMSSTLSPLLFV
ncbi:hypothetical protein MTR67_015212 [Solanum verrucosum]|uniref:Uncharacterized protein n=1 Tax=Solanum verrucosum TaxID=315347 RepID=A0AAF0QFC3_SOLVR|nr:hypothetical protein MTR67_015212 [Solanum verrucosum]